MKPIEISVTKGWLNQEVNTQIDKTVNHKLQAQIFTGR